MIIPTENTLISQVDYDRKDISEYSKQLCWNNVEYYSKDIKNEKLHDYSNRK